MYLNKSGNARDGEAFILVKHDGREDHIYGTGKDRKVVSSGVGEDSRPHRHDAPRLRPTTKGVRAGERTKQVEGRAYADILNGSRSGMFLNTSGNVRDGQAFVLVKREDREYHIYGTGKDRKVVGMKLPSETTSTETPDTTKTATTDTDDDRPRPRPAVARRHRKLTGSR